MPQPALTDGELMKKTLRTTLVMLGSTALWLGALSSIVVVSTGSSASEATESKLDKAPGAAAGVTGSGPAAAAKGPLIPGNRGMHRPGPALPNKGDPPRPGDPI